MIRRTLLIALLLTTACGHGTSIPVGATVLYSRDVGVISGEAIITGRDGGNSALIGGVSAWTFQDTILSAPATDGAQLRSSTFGTTTDLVASDGINALVEPLDAMNAPAQFLPYTADEQAFNDAHRAATDGTCAANTDCGRRWALWPGAMFTSSDGNSATMFYGKVDMQADGTFATVGTGVATWDAKSAPARGIIDASAAEPSVLFPIAPYATVAATVVVADNVYAYFCTPDFVIFVCTVGRAPVASVTTLSAWTFYDGTTWQSDFTKAKPALAGAPAMGVHFNAYLNKYVVVYSTPLDNTMELATADAPEGPWSGTLVFANGMTPTATTDTNDYGAVSHPEFSTGGGNVEYVTYYRPADSGGEMRLVEVTFQ